MRPTKCVLLSLVLSFTCGLSAEAQAHRGQMDTDGILSPGELRNPHIDYGDRYAYNDHWRSRDGGRHDHDRYHDKKHDWDDRRAYGNVLGGSFYDGIRSGRISRREEAELRDLQEDLRRRERDYLRDGRLSSWEREELDDREESLQDKLRHELGDGEKR